MDYYLCNKDTAPQLAATQADAKALDRKFTEYAVDTTKKPLMEFINKLLSGTSELSPPTSITIEAKLTPELSQDVERWAAEPTGDRPWERGPKTKEPPRYMTRYSKEADARVEFVPISVSAAIAHSYGGCPSCHRTPDAAKMLERIKLMDGITDFILGADEQALEKMEQFIAVRRAELEKAALQRVAAETPPKRKRAVRPIA